MIGLVYSDQQARCRRSSAVRQQGGSRCFSQVSEYLVDHRRVFDAGDDLDEADTFATNTGLPEGLLVADSGCTQH